MGRYEKEARRHIERIQYYYKYAGSNGYSQAEYHYNKLSDLVMKANRSKNDKSDVSIILHLKKDVEDLMVNMKKWENEGQ